LDFTSIGKRKFFCEEEVRLNRRLSSGIYLGVARITKEGDRISLEGRGDPVEYAVKMKQIPEEMLMGKLLEKRQVTPEMMLAAGVLKSLKNPVKILATSCAVSSLPL
jgi:aminoglycoside phosphotransferase family enzyme